MVILNILGKIEKMYISHKLGLYISNLPDGGEINWNNWQEGIKETLQIAYETEKLEASRYIGKFGSGPDNIFETRVYERATKILNQSEEAKEIVVDKYIDYLSKNMICIDIDYQKCEIPYGENTFSCFDWGSCEDEPVEKILEFLGFIARGIGNKSVTLPHCIYSTNQRRDREYRFLFSGTTDIDEPIVESNECAEMTDQEYRIAGYVEACNRFLSNASGGKVSVEDLSIERKVTGWYINSENIVGLPSVIASALNSADSTDKYYDYKQMIHSILNYKQENGEIPQYHMDFKWSGKELKS